MKIVSYEERGFHFKAIIKTLFREVVVYGEFYRDRDHDIKSLHSEGFSLNMGKVNDLIKFLAARKSFESNKKGPLDS